MAWRALAEVARRRDGAVAYVPSQRAGGRFGVIGEKVVTESPLVVPIKKTDVLLVALPEQQQAFALQFNSALVRSWVIVLRVPGTVADTAAALGADWQPEGGTWPAWAAVYRRCASSSSALAHQWPQAPRTATTPRITFVSIIGDGADFKHNLGTSRIYQERAASRHRWLLPESTGGEPLAAFLSALRLRLEREDPSELVLFLHADLHLPESFEAELFEAIGRLGRLDPRWALAGFFGVPLDWQPDPPQWPWRSPRIVGRGRDFYGRYLMGASNLTAAQCVDETALLLRGPGDAEPSPPFDAGLPSTRRIWLGGTDTVLEGLSHGRRSYILGVNVLHSIWDRAGRQDTAEQLRRRSIQKFSSAEATFVHGAAMSYMSQKFLWTGRVPRERVWSQNCGFDAKHWRHDPADMEGSIPFDGAGLKRALLERAGAP